MSDLVIHPLRLGVRAAGAVALAALVATSLPNLTRQADAQATVAAAPALDPSNIDPTCKACDDFYQFATGGWAKKTAIPTGHSRWGSFDELSQHNRDVLHTILEEAAKNTSAPAGSDEQKLGAFYRSCMNTEGIEAAGTAPIQPLLDAIASAKDTRGLVDEIVALQKTGVNGGIPLSARPDTLDSSKMIAGIGMGGLGIDRSYYLEDRFAQIRSAYRTYLVSELSALGESADRAAAHADAVVALETSIAKATPDRSEMRDPRKLYNPTPVAQLSAIAPHVPWNAYLADYGEAGLQNVNVTLPSFLTAYDALLASTPLDTWKAYLRAHVLDRYASVLPKRFEEPSFAFRSGVLLGVKDRLPRWQTCVTASDATLRDVLGKSYVARAFPASAKVRAQTMVGNLQGTLRQQIGTLDWMSPETKTAAIAKLDAYTKKIAYPDKWEDFAGLSFTNGAPYAADVLTAVRYENAKSLAEIGKPTNRTRWGMTPSTVNAYYSPSNNEIVFPAGILGGAFFNPTADDAVNYGGIGAVIGHEMTHGFDDQGRRYDAQGNLRDWWTPADATNFSKRAQCIVDEYTAFEPLPGLHMKGTQVQGEAIADLGGATIAFKAFEKTAEYKSGKKIDGYTPAQRFFLSFAQVWRQLQTEGALRQQVLSDAHPYAKYRVDGTLSNMPEFQRAFACAANTAMVRKDRCQIW